MHTPDDSDVQALDLERDELHAELDEAGLIESEPEADDEERDGYGVETAWGPWRRVGDHYEPAAPLASGPTRYRVHERVERRVRWHERKAAHYEVVGTEYGRDGRAHSIVLWSPATERELDEPELYEVTVPAIPGEELTDEQYAEAVELQEEHRAEAEREFLATPGWSIEYAPATGNPPGRRPVDVTAELNEALVAVVGGVDDVRRLTPPGRPKVELRAERLELARRVASVLDVGAGNESGRRVVQALTEVYGRSRHTFYELAKLGGWRNSDSNP